MSAFFDSDVLVYLFDADAPVRQEAARRLFEWHARAGDLLLSPTVLEDFYVAVTSGLGRPLAVEDAAMVLMDMAALHTVPLDASLVLAAAQRTRGDSLPMRAALMIETALRGGARVLYSEDLAAGRRFGSLTVEDPFSGLVR